MHSAICFNFCKLGAAGATWRLPGPQTESPRFPFKDSFKGDIEIGIDVDVDIIDIGLDARGT